MTSPGERGGANRHPNYMVVVLYGIDPGEAMDGGGGTVPPPLLALLVLILPQELEDRGEVFTGVAPSTHHAVYLVGQGAQRDRGLGVGGCSLG